MKAPRRFRRRLLLPPGWVALGCLLWLGCMLVQGQWRRLRPERVVQLTMTSLEVKSEFCWASLRYNREIVEQVISPEKLDINNSLSDSLTAKRVALALHNLNYTSQSSKGLTIRFAPTSRYQQLILILDLLASYKEKRQRYFLDIYQKPAVLYILGPNFVAKDLDWCPRPPVVLPPI